MLWRGRAVGPAPWVIGSDVGGGRPAAREVRTRAPTRPEWAVTSSTPAPGRRLEPQPHHLRRERHDAVLGPRGRRGPQRPESAGDHRRPFARRRAPAPRRGRSPTPRRGATCEGLRIDREAVAVGVGGHGSRTAGAVRESTTHPSRADRPPPRPTQRLVEASALRRLRRPSSTATTPPSPTSPKAKARPVSVWTFFPRPGLAGASSASLASRASSAWARRRGADGRWGRGRA